MPLINTLLSDWATPPGSTVAEILEERNVSLHDFAIQMHQSPKATVDLLEGRVEMSEQIASQLETILGSSKRFWLNRERQYREALLRIQDFKQVDESRRWLDELPTRELVKLGWIESAESAQEKVAECLRFFGTPNIEHWRDTYQKVIRLSAFRTSSTFDSKPGAVAAWLRQGEIQADMIECGPWSLEGFKASLLEIRLLTRKRDPQIFLPELQSICARSGVAVVIVRTPLGCKASGSTRFISDTKAVLSLSFRYLSDDHFWFTFFHEAAHLILHQKDKLFLEWSEGAPSSNEETEANEYAADVLIPQQFRHQLPKIPLDGREVIRFARSAGISPGIVVGQLQHLGLFRRNQLNNLKTRFAWSTG